MSIRWMSMVWSQAVNVKGTELLVLLSLADHSQDDGSSFPSVGRIATRARTTQRNVQYALAKLESKGWVTRNQRGGRSTIYQLAIPPEARGRADEDGFGVQSFRGEEGFVFTPKPTAPITIREPTTPSGGVSEALTERLRPESPAPPDHPVTEQPFPRFAIAALGSVTANEQEDWLTAWRTVTSQAVQWDAQGHLTKYLARCKESKKTPKPTEWVRWWVEDEQAERRKARESAASNDETPRPWFE